MRFLTLLSLLHFLLSVSVVAQTKPDLLLFDEDDLIGTGYYDASFAQQVSPSSIAAGGPGDKMIVLTNHAYTGQGSGLLSWQSAPLGNWKLFIAPPGFKTADLSDYTSLLLWVNGPSSISATDLPALSLESSPPDAISAPIQLGEYLPQGLDGDPLTWQKVLIPLKVFAPGPGFSLSKVKDACFRQGAADNVPHTLWVDHVRFLWRSGSKSDSLPPSAPSGLVSRSGDRSIVLHWENDDPRPGTGYHVYRLTQLGERRKLTPGPTPLQSFADLDVTNGETYSYVVRAVNLDREESVDSNVASATPSAFRDDSAFLEYLQHTAFDFFWYETNPRNGLVRDRSDPAADSSIAAVGFGLTGLGIAVEHHWISRAQAAARTFTTLRTLWELPQGPQLTGTAGNKGWFYHFLDMESGLRAGTSELSTVDTAWLLAGVLAVKQFFDREDPQEASIRTLSDSIFNRVDWRWMADKTGTLSYGWKPESGFLTNRWIGYNEAMLLYLLGMGAQSNPLPSSAWTSWCSGYTWQTHEGQTFLTFPPLFGHQYSHCWIDFRDKADAALREKKLTYFENSRRATLAQRAYCIANSPGFAGYSSNLWGLTACNGPGVSGHKAYAARGAPPAENDDGTIAPTAAAASLPFTPEYSLPVLRLLYENYRTNIWTGYGFCDAFNLQAKWWDSLVLGIDQGPILLMAENFRSGHVWNWFMKNQEVKRGLTLAGFQESKP